MRRVNHGRAGKPILQDLMGIEEVLWIELPLEFSHQRPGRFLITEQGYLAFPTVVAMDDNQIAPAFPGQSPQVSEQCVRSARGRDRVGKVTNDDAAGGMRLNGASGPLGFVYK